MRRKVAGGLFLEFKLPKLNEEEHCDIELLVRRHYNEKWSQLLQDAFGNWFFFSNDSNVLYVHLDMIGSHTEITKIYETLLIEDELLE